MATAREHFALDWIKADLLETLNDARVALDEYAELGKEETRMRACLTSLHQVHGTLVMLELKGVSQLADHLEQLAQALLGQKVHDEAGAGQALMQGILELPGYLDEIQRGAEDSVSTSMGLVNEIRSLLALEHLVDPAGTSLREGASDEVVARFNAIGGPEKVARIRSAYQNVLLSILKGEDRSTAVGTLGKIAIGLEKVTEGAPLARQWQAFEEFVNSLKQHGGALESEAVKLLRRVDLEIKALAKDGEIALRKPVNMELVQQLLDGAIERNHQNEAVVGLQEAVARDVSNNTLAISGRQALGSAAHALQEDLAFIKDKLDLLVRADLVDLEELRSLTAPLKQVGSTLSLLGFESSREIISDQVDAIENLVVLGDADPQGVQSIAGALVQIDENLSSVILGSGQSEVEQITSEAQLQVLREARKDLDTIKQSIVDFVTAHWSIGHLEEVPAKLTEIAGALGIIPLTRAIDMLGGVGQYVETRLLQGHRPEWQELDQFADVISALDYYLERLADETSSGAEDILVVAERSLAELDSHASPATDVAEAAVAPAFAEVDAGEQAALDAVIDDVVDNAIASNTVLASAAEADEALAFAADAAELVDASEELKATEPVKEDTELSVTAESEESAEDEQMSADATASEQASATQEPEETSSQNLAAEQVNEIDEGAIPSIEEPKLAMEEDAGFDLSSDVFADLDGAVEHLPVSDAEPAPDSAESTTELSLEPFEPEQAETENEAENTAESQDSANVFTESAPLHSDAELDAAEASSAEESAADDYAAIEYEPVDMAATPALSDDAEQESAANVEPEEAVVEQVAAAEVELPDPEIVEIFVEEVDEVLGTIQEYLPQWAADFAQGDALTEVRRAFHTLKGSGRIVQAAAIGELAWGIENMLNRVIENTVTPNAQFVAAIEAACALVPDLRTAFAAGEQGNLDNVSLVIEQADVLASGGEIDVAVFAAEQSAEIADELQTEAIAADEPGSAEQPLTEQSPEAPEQILEEVDELSFDADEMADAFVEDAERAEDDTADLTLEPMDEAPAEDLEAFDLEKLSLEPLADKTEDALEMFVDEPSQTEPDSTVDESLPEEVQATAQADAEQGQQDLEREAEQVEPTSVDQEEESTLELFLSEALEHLAIMQADNAQTPWTLSDGIARAFHTLTGIAGLAEVDQVRLIVEPAYQVVEAFRNAPPTEQLQAFFLQAQTHLVECIDALQSSASWEEPLEFVAAADDLLALQGSGQRAVDMLLDAPVTASLFELEDQFMEYLVAHDRGMDDSGETAQPIAGLQDMLGELASLASDMQAQPLADLSLALQSVVTTAAPLSRLPSGAATVMRAGYHQLIDQLNEIAAGSDVVAQDELITALLSLEMTESAVDVAEEAKAEEAVSSVEATSEGLDAELVDLAEVDPDLIQVFFEEAEEICEELEASIMSWSTERDNRIYMENMLRGLHTLKGGARLCGLSKLGDMAHDFESMVIEVQSNDRSIDDRLFTDLNSRYDEIANRVSSVSDAVNVAEASGTPISSAIEAPVAVTDETQTPDEAAEPANVEALDNVVELPTSEPTEPEPVEEQPAPEPAPAVSDVNKIVEAVVAPAAQAKAQEPAKETASAKSESPAAGGHEMVRVGSALLEELVNLAGESSILRARIEQGMSDFTGALDEMETTIERLREQLRRLEIETETQILHRHERHDGPQYENFDPLEMDRYNQLQQLSRGLSESASDMLDLKETLLFKARESETLLLQQARINTELQEGLMRTRMVPFSRLMPRLRRIVRQVSNELGKEVEFHVQNAEGELDRNLLERMVPPLEHMLRNAVDHGIESEELRRNYGKPAGGRIDLRLTREGGDVVIEISDDGAGIDVEGVRAKAIERGLMAADAQLADEEVLQFVLAAGFSTAKSVTQISGRGVGLDVVASEVKQLGGSVSILSAPGKGTRFVVRVPFTVSVNRALMVSVAEDLYAIPLNTIEGIVLLSPDQLQALYSSESKTFEYAGIPYRVRYLGQYLGREYRGSSSAQASVPMVLVRSGDHAVAIHVDLVQGSREIVVKSLGPQFAGVGGISGATILGDGSVVVILDLLALIRAQQFERQRKVPGQGRRTGPRCVMVVDDSVTVRKVTSRLLERQGMDVLVAKDGVEAVAMLQERRPDVMLLDIEMPRMDGFEVARQVRHDDRLGDLPIVMISSRTGDKHKEHANQLGVNKFLGKPFQENELLATIDELVTRS